MRAEGLSWALLSARWVLGLMFLVSGWWKVVQLGAVEHARRFFVEGYAESWLPLWLLWALGVAIPFVELLAGGLMCLGWRVREAGAALGLLLVVVTYGHLLKEPLFDITSHIFPRLALLAFVLASPPEGDRWSLDSWLRRGSVAGPVGFAKSGGSGLDSKR